MSRLFDMGPGFLSSAASRQTKRVGLIAGIAVMLGSSTGPANLVRTDYPDVPFDGKLSVLTYNVKGLPWPLASGRTVALQKIAERLSRMRQKGRHPEIILLQEAFTREAQLIGRLSGYQYITDGPLANSDSPFVNSKNDREFAATGSWLKGEGLGKFIGSGLQILSDFPITAVHKTAFPEHACAGFDCLANKGVMLVDIYVPQLGTKVQVGNIHMNSKRSSYASMERRIAAYRRQVDAAHLFYVTHRDSRYPLVFGGDFNPGTLEKRQNALFSKPWPVQRRNDALRQIFRYSGLSADAQAAMERAADWQFIEPGTGSDIRPEAALVPFSSNDGASSLSDHVGYMIEYVIE